MASEPLHLSVIIPAYNEAARIGGTLDRFQAYLSAQPYSSEVLVVDDGSEDDTARVVREGYPAARLISNERNRGKGFALRHGLAEAGGEYRLVYDADGSTPVEDIEKLWPLFEAGAAVVIGSRALPESEVRVRQPIYRQKMGRMFNLLLRCLRLTRFRDTQCGFKALTKEASDAIVPRLTRDGYGLDCELLYAAERRGMRVDEMPVIWINSLDSRVKPILDSIEMTREVLIVRWNAWLGRYS